MKQTKLIAALDMDLTTLKILTSDVAHSGLEWVKVGPIPFLQGGRNLIKYLKELRYKIMLDLKFHDIPNTVEKAAAEAVNMGVDMFTIHASGGSDMINAAMKGADNKAKVLAVTILTSHNNVSLCEVGFSELMDIPEHVKNLVDLTCCNSFDYGTYGIPGIVCSPFETELVRSTSKDCIIVNPGIRLPSNDNQDQKRVATPTSAQEAGADFIVVGRPIYQAEDPKAAIDEINKLLQDNISVNDGAQ